MTFGNATLGEPAASSEGETVVRHKAAPSPIRLLYVCDFPPSNLRGGTILMSRLLQEYPRDRITVLAGSQFMQDSPQQGRIDCEHVVFPATNGSGRWGIGRLKAALDWCLIPALALLTIWLTWRRRVNAIVTVAHGHFFMAAALAARMTGTPYVLVVHDDWVFTQAQGSHVLRYIAGPVFRLVARGASHIYSVSWHMQEWLRSAYGVSSEVQLPACDPHPEAPTTDRALNGLKIVFAGTGSAANDDSLALMVDIIKRDELKQYGINSARLILYTTPVSDALKRQLGRDHPLIDFRPWVAQPELPDVLASADILFLPFSFLESQEIMVSRSFPSKLADYLASGKPILIVGPGYADIVRYAMRCGFAEVVDRSDREAVVRAIVRIATSPAHREELRTRALRTFMQNHNISVQRQDLYQTLQRLTLGLPPEATVSAASACCD